MSRIRFPRVAPRTRPRPAVPNLPKLKLAIYDHGVLAAIKELDDPRIGFCREFNVRCPELGLTAVPLTEGMVDHE